MEFPEDKSDSNQQTSVPDAVPTPSAKPKLEGVSIWTCVITLCAILPLVTALGAWFLWRQGWLQDVLFGCVAAAGEPAPARSGQLAFISDRDGNPEIYVMNVDGTGVKRLTHNAAGNLSPAWSPDGTQIAFYSMRDGNAEIYVMNADGTGQKRLTDSSSGDFAPAWSPDGSQIAFHSHRFNEDSPLVYVMDTDGSDVTRLMDPAPGGWTPAWSPDGSQIAFNSGYSGNPEIWVMNFDGTQRRNISTNPADDSLPDWSPDGQRMVFYSARDGGFEIYSMRPDGSDVKRLTNHPGDDYDPAWSPDGRRIAFTFGGITNSEICMTNADGTGLTSVTRNPANDWWPAWRPDASLARVPLVARPTAVPTATSVPKELPTSGNLALDRPVSASQSEFARPASRAVDGSPMSDWSSGNLPPQWIQIDLGAPADVLQIRLLVEQSSGGSTEHHILVGPEPENMVDVHQFQGRTYSGQWLLFSPEPPLSNVRYVRVLTSVSPAWVGWGEVQVIGVR